MRARTLDLSATDPAIDALAQPAREQVAAVLCKRARGELQVAAAFAAITRALLDAGAERTVLRLLADAIADELHHAELWHALAGRYHGAELPWPPPLPLVLPAHRDAPEALRPTMHLVGLACINETVATTRLEAAFRATRGVLMRQAVKIILEDEVRHARAGWAHVASTFVTPAMRAELARHLPELLAANLGALYADVEVRFDGSLAAHGLLSVEEVRRVIDGALCDVVLPGFAHAGLDAAAAQAWWSEAKQGGMLNSADGRATG